MSIKVICVCSGISAPSAAWVPQGFEFISYAEIDPYAAAVLAARYGAGKPQHMPDPDEPGLKPEDRNARRAAIKMLERLDWGSKVPNCGDFTRLRDQLALILEADVLVGGTPCQGFSLAGLRGSMSDDRSNLCLEFIRLADAIDDLRRAHGRPPLIILWENVPGVLSTRDGAFGHFLGGLVGSDAPLVPPKGRSWTDAGVVAGPRRTAAFRTLNAQYFGLAQRRRRVFVLATSGSRAWCVADALLPIIDSLRRHPAPGRQAGPHLAAGLEPGPLGGDQRLSGRDDTGGGGDAPEPDPGRGDDSGGGPVRTGIEAFGGNRTSGALEVAAALQAHKGPKGRQDFETDTFVVEPGDPSHPLTATGHAPAVAYALRGYGEFRAEAEALRASGGDQGGGSESLIVAFSSKDDGSDATEDLSPTLRAMGHDSSHANSGGQVAVAFSIMPMNSSTDYKAREVDVAQPLLAGGPGMGAQGGDFVVTDAVAFSMRGRDGENMAEPEEGDVAPALRTGGGGSDKPFVAYSLSPGAGSDGLPSAVETEIAPTLTAEAEANRNGRGTHIVQPDPFVFKSSHYTRDKDGAPSDIVPALSADADKGDQDPLVYVNSVAPTLSARASAGGGLGTDADHQGAVLQTSGSAVRRLTVTECERLQGVPDGYTLIPWPSNSKRDGVDLEETIAYLLAAGYGANEAAVLAHTPDGPRYRVLGNSMAKDVLENLGLRIQWVFEVLRAA